MKVKALIMFSGGLDSILAAEIMQRQKDVECEAVHCYTVFLHHSLEETSARLSLHTDRLGLPLKILDFSAQHISLVKNPASGFGVNVNPCIDCKLWMFKLAGDYMKQSGASFLVSGEVIGQRPMSQRKEVFSRIERIAGLRGLILRPLSARLLPVTIPEEKGWVDRETLYDIQSRSRKKQMQLAKEFAVGDFPNPGGGCLLTDPGYSRRVKDLLINDPGFGEKEVVLLRFGRHFRLSPRAKLIVPRNVEEADRLLLLATEDMTRFAPDSFNGYESLGVGEFDDDSLQAAAAIISHYYPRSAARTVRVLRAAGETVIEPEAEGGALRRQYLI